MKRKGREPLQKECPDLMATDVLERLLIVIHAVNDYGSWRHAIIG